jgi:hypothetical protein
MRAVLLAGLLVASIPWGPRPLPAATPVAIISSTDCAAGARDARFIAETLGFVHTSPTCQYGSTYATLSGTTAPRIPAVRSLIAYSIVDSNAFQPRNNFLTFEVPDDIPWVSAQATALAYVKIDALLLDIQADNILDTAFALEKAGVSRDDMMANPRSPERRLLVRVWPLTVARVREIAQVARQQVDPRYTFYFEAKAFIRDCDSVVAPLNGLALSEARARANAMARAAHTKLAEPLAVIDSGGTVVDAICGLGSDATVHQLAALEEAGNYQNVRGGNLDATIVLSISAAWRLNLPPNPPGTAWRGLPPNTWYALGGWVGFLADGQRALGDALLPNSIIADHVRALVPDWAESALQKSPYAYGLTHVSFDLSPFRPALVLRAGNPTMLSRKVNSVRAFISHLPQNAGRSVELGLVYGRDDCRAAVRDALFQATGKAIAQLHGARIRYLQERSAETIGPVSCAYEPTEDDWPSAGVFGASVGSVAVGY